MEFRGHEHVLECAIFAPVNSYQYIQELIGDEVSKKKGIKWIQFIDTLPYRTNQKINCLVNMSLLVQEIKQ